jgi:hypothetical protein
MTAMNRDPLALEFVRTLVAEAVRDSGYDPYGMGHDGDPHHVADLVAQRLTSAEFEYRKNDNGVVMRRAVVATQWAIDPVAASTR